ncbi:TatD family hydrolase [Phormidium sp. FACHB-592]|uniref:D-aminoacyl-tRNA deacylase n=1 Tax=Stenomitos frigidus AS-A4 TaxID=2933935 RepID=A0ABV0KE12_9CYAN|nr:TatD family hydrolase [Phormidium sp. FACHB-592]MBD2076052.1 TatD family hydrolase [Phormidium sp. FACHB-592]
MQLIDTHVHINFDSFQADLDTIAVRWRDSGITRLVHSCVSPDEFPVIKSLADRFSELFFAVGLHPLDVETKWMDTSANEILTLAQSDTRVVAIGETGLDFFKASNREQQEAAFNAQLRIAQQLDRPVIIHCREAAESMAAMLRTFWQQHGAVKGVMHCWGGTPEETQWFLDLGLFVSFSGTVTFPKATQIHESAQMVPGDRLLIETDCPFLAPVPKRGQRNEPAYVRFVAEQVARLRQMPLSDLALQTTQNACRLFNLPIPVPLLPATELDLSAELMMGTATSTVD